MTSSKVYKLVLIGEAQRGKTWWTSKLHLNDAPTKYIPTLGVEVHPLVFETNKGEQVCFNAWDTAGNPKFSGLRGGYAIQANCFLLFTKEKGKISTEEMEFAKDYHKVSPSAPMISCHYPTMVEDGDLLRPLKKLLRKMKGDESLSLKGYGELVKFEDMSSGR
jgi:GTP-binding nuclear protein Ran